MSDSNISALIEAIIYLAEEPVRPDQIAKALKDVGKDRIAAELDRLKQRYSGPDHGIEIREIAGGYRFSTKPEHHEVLTHFARSMVPPTRLSLAALETLAVIAYRQPVTVPEIQEIRGVQASGVIKTLLDRRLVTAAGRKDVIGRPILYKTTRQFLLHFGLKSLDELPSMEEFEELIKSEHADGAVQAELPIEESSAPGPAPDTDRARSEATEATEATSDADPKDAPGPTDTGSGERDDETGPSPEVEDDSPAVTEDAPEIAGSDTADRAAN